MSLRAAAPETTMRWTAMPYAFAVACELTWIMRDPELRRYCMAERHHGARRKSAFVEMLTGSPRGVEIWTTCRACHREMVGDGPDPVKEG